MPVVRFARLLQLALCLLLPLWIAASAAATEPAGVQVLTQALTVDGGGDAFPEHAGPRPVTLPDEWSTSRPRYDGSAWYRLAFRPPARAPGELLAVYIERACANVDIVVNGQLIHRDEPTIRHCLHPQIVVLPSALLVDGENRLDLHLRGNALQRVAARQRAAGLSEVHVGPYAVLAEEHATRLFWNITAVQIVGATLVVFGVLLLALYRNNRREVYLLYFAGLVIGWGLLSARVWWADPPLNTRMVEFLVCAAFPPVVACAVQFLLAYAGLRSRMIEVALAVQCVLMPVTLWLAGPNGVFALSEAWYVLLMIEVAAAIVLYLRVTWRHRRRDFWPMTFILGGTTALLLLEMAVQHRVVRSPPLQLLNFVVPLLLLAIGSRLLQIFAHALEVAEQSRRQLESRVKEITAEIERNYAQLSEMRVEQVTEKERKRIAADLHDDLGAKLLTIVHTSESERISTLAREALEEMRLSVRGLTGKPVRLADAMADWRAETVLRLGQANVESEWRGPTDDVDQLLPARAYVQTTRILREAVSNIIKHSAASQCAVRVNVGERDFEITIQDNGKGIPLELDGKLDRGHGMTTMKHRAKQMQGQCLVESGPGYGTVIRLTLPL